MADDRLYIQCNICGKKFFIGKQFAYGSFYLQDYYTDDKPFIDRLNEFYEDHNHCERYVCRWNGNYSLVYETDDWKNSTDIAIPYQYNETKECEGCEGLAMCEKNRRKGKE